MMTMRRRGRSKANPSMTTLAVLGGGLALLGIGVYFATRSSSTSQQSSDQSKQSSDASKAPPPPGGRPFGDPADQNSVAYACNACRKLLNVGQTAEAAVWQQKCVAGGGTVPPSMSTLYT
jgi:hypothetical protein